MEVLAAFLLLLVAIAAIVIGGLLWIVASSLRRRKLASGEDEIDRHMIGAEVGAAGAGAHEGEGRHGGEQERTAAGRPPGRERARGRPEHHRVTNEQGSRSIPRR